MKRRTRAVICILTTAWFIAASIGGILWHYNSLGRLEKLGWIMVETYGLSILTFLLGLIWFLSARSARPFLRIPQQTADDYTGTTPTQYTCTLRINISGELNDWIIVITDDIMRLKCTKLNREFLIYRNQSNHSLRFPNIFSDCDLIIEDSSGEELIAYCDGKRRDIGRIKRWWEWSSKINSTSITDNPDSSTYSSAKILNNSMSMQRRSGIAIASLVCGIIGGMYSSASIPAIICGHISLSKIKKYPLKYGGKGMAITGLILGYIGFILAIILGSLRGVLWFQIMQLKQMGY
jgi:hypothetical protein